MSDFDKFFAERLNEETEFPLREKNWKALAQRLDVAGAGAVTTGLAALKLWKAAVLGLALTSGVLVWKFVALREENTRLRDQIEQLRQAIPQNTPVASAKDFEGDTWHAPFVWQYEKGEQTTGNNGVDPRDFSHDDAPVVMQRSQKRPANIPVATSDPVSPAAPYPEVQHDEKQAEFAGTAGQHDAGAELETLVVLPDLPPLPQTDIPVVPIPAPEMKQTTVPVPPITKPYREKAGRFRVGIQGVAAIPNPLPSGVSAPKGIGATVEYSPLRNVWLSASADWLSYQVSGNRYLPPQFFHAPQPMPAKFPQPGPNPPKPQPYPLVQVQGSQRIQFYNLGVRYALPVRFPIRPSVHLMHTWARFTPELYVFEFEDDKPGGPNPHPAKKFILSSSAPEQTISNLWRMGFGLEYETRDWVFRAGVDWVENSAASKPVFDAALVQGTVLYKF